MLHSIYRFREGIIQTRAYNQSKVKIYGYDTKLVNDCVNELKKGHSVICYTLDQLYQIIDKSDYELDYAWCNGIIRIWREI